LSTTAVHLKSSASRTDAGVRPIERRSLASRLNRAGVGYALAALAIVVGYRASDGYYLTAESGLGYALGIIGGSLMLALLVYPLRKRYRVLRFLGSTTSWFKSHMFLGVVGPILILYHASFNMGSTNSSVAMVCMLLVAGSGIVGRYLYSKIHNGLYGGRVTLEELRRDASGDKEGMGGLRLLPGVLAELEGMENALIKPASGLIAGLNPFLAGFRVRIMHRRFDRKVASVIARMAKDRPIVAQHSASLRLAAMRYSERRLQAARRVAQFQLFERLFSLWHVLHLPLFLLMVATAIIHVIAVHLY
jgi:hypothetical protein